MELKKYRNLRLITIVVGIVVAIIFFSLAIVGFEVENLAMVVSFLILMVLAFIVTFYVAREMNDRVKGCCHSCGDSLYGADYKYQQATDDLDVNVSEYGSTKIKHTAVFEITAVCPHCGSENVIHKKFVAKNGSTTLEYQIDKYCIKLFGVK